MEPGMKQNIPVNLKFNKNCLGLFLINETNYPKVTTYIWKYQEHDNFIIIWRSSSNNDINQK